MPVGEVPSYTRYDLQHVADASHRPTDAEYDRFLWLLELLKRTGYEEAEIYASHPFLVKDVLFSAILVAANESLLDMAEAVDAPDGDREQIQTWIHRGRSGLDGCWDAELRLCLDQDVRTGRLRGFAP